MQQCSQPARGAGRDDELGAQRPKRTLSDRPEVGTDAPYRVLLVEDEYFIALELEEWLLDAGYDVVASVNSAAEAIEAANAEKPDLIVMDVRLVGEQDGIYAAAKIHQELGIRSLFASAHLDSNAEARAASAEPLGWLPKPFSREAFLKAMAEATGQLKSGPAQ
jgi:two-component system, response regulator PdtaR